jgi:hypothetical protein
MFIKTDRFRRMLTPALIMAFLAMLSGCGTGGLEGAPAASPGSGTTGGGTTGGTTTPVPSSLNLSASPTTVKSDGSTTSTITVNALNASNASLSGVTVTLSTDTGVLGTPTVFTDTTTPATVTFYSGGNPINRTATITATAGTVSTQIPIQIVGSTVTLTSTGTTLPNDGTSPITATVTAKDSGNIIVPNAAVVLASAGAGNVTITPASGTTLSDGTFTATVKGAASGAVTLTATALGATATKELTITAVGASFAIDQQKLNGAVIANDATTAMKIGETLELRVNAPTSGTVTFATTIGVWDGGTKKEVTKTVVSGKATATLSTTQAGVANIQVYANKDTNDTLTVAISSGAAAYRIIIQAAPTNVPVSVGTTTGSSTLTATVYDNASPNPNPIGGVPVLFSIVNPTSGGETVLPVVATSAETTSGGLSLGQASASFTSGSMPSGAYGMKIRASVVGTTVATNTSPSGDDATIIIGGVASSIAFGQATIIGELDPATYKWPMSVLVADSAGAALSNADISLSVWPIAWSTGEAAACAYDADNGSNRGTFWNEDRNENLFLDASPAPAEDGARYYYADKSKSTLYIGTADGYITPTNSAGGTVPSKITTDSNGVATFNLIYPKQSAIWTIVRIRATTKVLGSETRSELILRLLPAATDVLPCSLGKSPYKF